MKQNIEYGLEGAFKVDLYDAKGNCVQSGDWFKNFITQTGLMYPKDYSFANCFRFLTIGSSSSDNNGGKDGTNATTGCYSPFHSFTVTPDGITNQTQKGSWMGYEGYETGVLGNSTCQTVFESRGVRFYRAWSVPSGAAGTVVNEPGGFLNIQEFAVSPSSGGDPRGAAAFSRVKRNLPIANGYRAVVSYQLFVQMKNYTVTPFPSNTFITDNADVSNDPDLIGLWKGVSGFYRQVWPGFNCIDYYGVTFTPKYGCGMEPSVTNLDNYFVYFSPDNSAFDVNMTGGGPAKDPTGAWKSEGVMGILPSTLVLNETRESLPSTQEGLNDLFYGTPAIKTAVPTQDTPWNIRLGSVLRPLTTVDVADYTKDMNADDKYDNKIFNYQQGLVNASVETISHATAGTSGVNDDRSVGSYSVDGNLQKAIFSTRMYRLPMDMQDATAGEPYNYNAVTGRKKNITRRAVFAPASSLGYNSRFGSMVFAYMASRTSEGNAKFYPIMDALFYDSSGLAMLQHYRLISGIYLTERGTGVLHCRVGIFPQHADGNVSKWATRNTIQSFNSGYVPVPGWFLDESGLGYNWRRANLISGRNHNLYDTTYKCFGTSGNHDFSSGYHGDICSGWGAVMGIQGDDYNHTIDPGYVANYDQGVCEHPTGLITEPTGRNPSALYWPYVHAGPSTVDSENALHLDFFDIAFYKPVMGLPMTRGTFWPDNSGGYTPAQLASASGFCRPTGYIVHYDAIGPAGNRLLPHFGRAKIDANTNTYYIPSIGGGYPAFSMDNGMEVYIDMSWSSDCVGAVNCFEPPA